jgi:hypothetical protein
MLPLPFVFVPRQRSGLVLAHNSNFSVSFWTTVSLEGQILSLHDLTKTAEFINGQSHNLNLRKTLLTNALLLVDLNEVARRKFSSMLNLPELVEPERHTSRCNAAIGPYQHGCKDELDNQLAGSHSTPVSDLTEEQKTQRIRVFAEGGGGSSHMSYTVEVGGGQTSAATSGPGSEPGAGTRDIAQFLPQFLRDNNISSLLEVSSGHWRSGWQPTVLWPEQLHYTGVDITESVVEDNKLFLHERNNFSMMSTTLVQADMTTDLLPQADLLFTKDTLIHLSNEDVVRFLRKNVLMKPRRYKYVLFVHDDWGGFVNQNIDIKTGDFRRLRLHAPPFNLATETVMTYQSNRLKLVELLRITDDCGELTKFPLTDYVKHCSMATGLS